MIKEQKIQHIIFNPLWPVMLYLLISITTFHEKIEFLKLIHFESLILLLCIILSIINFKLSSTQMNRFYHPIIVSSLLGFVYVTAPIMTSIAVNANLDIIWDGEFQTLLKIILFAPCFLWITFSTPYKNKIIDLIIVFYLFLGIYFMYRYKFLNEIREIDNRPSLKIRHGDANFLSTFFSMVVPLALMQFHYYYYQLKNNLKAYLFLMISLFLIFCSYQTQSRMGLIALSIGLIYLLSKPIWHFSWKSLILMTSIILIGIIGIKSNGIGDRFNNLKDKSNIDRISSWKNGLIILSENPILGIGLHQAKNSYYQNTYYPSFKSDSQQLDIHNTFLKIAAEFGYLGLVLFLSLFLLPLNYILKLKNNETFFLLASYLILTITCLTTGLGSKDLFIFQLFLLTGLAIPSTKEIMCK